jgi:hypothetical protein
MKQYLIGGLTALLLAGGIVGAATQATAANDNGADPGFTGPNNVPRRVIHPRGVGIAHARFVNGSVYAILRGKVESVTTSTILLTGLGGTWTIRYDAETRFAPTDLVAADLKPGDLIAVRGVASTDEQLTLDAKHIRRWIPRHIPRPIGRMTAGTVTTLAADGTSFAISTKNGDLFTVQTTETTRFRDRNRTDISFNDLRTDDIIHVIGARDGSTITAFVVRDLSIPR